MRGVRAQRPFVVIVAKEYNESEVNYPLRMTDVQGKKIQEVADKGTAIYEEIKAQYDPKEKGKFLAIDPVTKDVFLGVSSAQALVSAKAKHPDGFFFVVKIGYDVAETIARSILERKSSR